jgi:hypothetical protein
MSSNEPIITPEEAKPSPECSAAPAEVADADAELQRIRKLRVMATVSAPLLMSLLMSRRANAWSPPPDPESEP